MERDGLTVYLAEIERRTVGTATLVLMPDLTHACAATALIEGIVVIPGFVGGVTMAEELARDGVTVFYDVAALPGLRA